MPLADALETVAHDGVEPVAGGETVAVEAALGRVLAGEQRAPIDLPPFDRATMTGFAAHLGEPAAAPRLRLSNATVDDASEATALPPGTAARVATGAAVPRGADRVVAREDALVERGYVRLASVPPLGANIRRRGGELRAGAVVQERRRLLSAPDVAMLAAPGLERVAVTRAVRVALLAVGDELTPPGRALSPGGLFDASRVLLRLPSAGPAITVVGHATVGDDGAAIEARRGDAVASADVVIVTGGLGAAGEPEALPARLGGRLVLDRAAAEPGKPVVFGRIGDVPLCGLPGNPVAAFVTFAPLVRPLLARRAGTAPRQPLAMLAECGFSHARERGRTGLIPLTLDGGGPRPRLRRPAMVGAAEMSALAAADGLAVVTHDRGDLAPGDPIGFVPFAEVFGL